MGVAALAPSHVATPTLYLPWKRPGWPGSAYLSLSVPLLLQDLHIGFPWDCHPLGAPFQRTRNPPMPTPTSTATYHPPREGPESPRRPYPAIPPASHHTKSRRAYPGDGKSANYRVTPTWYLPGTLRVSIYELPGRSRICQLQGSHYPVPTRHLQMRPSEATRERRAPYDSRVGPVNSWDSLRRHPYTGPPKPLAPLDGSSHRAEKQLPGPTYPALTFGPLQGRRQGLGLTPNRPPRYH